MYETLIAVEHRLPELLADEHGWDSVFVDYEHPHVERLWRSWEEYRISLHRIHPCQPDQALFHPHPWPQAIRILEGQYLMNIGYGPGSTPPPIAATVLMQAGSFYTMTDIDGWHSVQPIDRPTLSLMVTGKPWDRPSPKSDYKLRPLTEPKRTNLFERFRTLYPATR